MVMEQMSDFSFVGCGISIGTEVRQNVTTNEKL